MNERMPSFYLLQIMVRKYMMIYLFMGDCFKSLLNHRRNKSLKFHCGFGVQIHIVGIILM